MKTSKAFFNRLLTVYTWLIEKSFDLWEPVSVVFRKVRAGGITFKGDFFYMQLKEGQKVTLSAELRTRGGNAAAYEKGSVSWKSSDETIASVEPNPDNELEAVVRGKDGSDNGSAVITFRADGDPEAYETREIIGTLDVVVTQGEATVVSLSAGTPTEDDGANETTSTDSDADADETAKEV